MKGYGGDWRTHESAPGKFDYCQEVDCPKAHFISTFKGSSPVQDKWDGVLDSDGKVGK